MVNFRIYKIGEFTYSNGDVYNGGWKDDKKNGYGNNR